LRQFVGIQEWDPSGDFDGKSVKLTGSFVRLKKDYEAALVECNATVQNTVTKKTHFVVEGAQTSAEIAAGGSKASKEAIRLKAAGQNIEILDEADLLDLLAR
jgi:NAD-dependent DNA ligase